jgi:citrate lyase subunit beta / citryl-CoA lyase
MPERRARRSELATPASNQRMCEKAASSGADLVFLDLEDACAPSAKEAARGIAVAALRDHDWGRTVRAVRVNGLDTAWCHDDVIEVVTGAREVLDIIIVPKVRSARDVWWVDVLLTQLEQKLGLTKRIGLEVLIEEAEGLVNAAEVARASSRLEAIIFGAGDLSASLRARVDGSFDPVHDYPGDFWHYARSQVLTAARAAGVDAIDAPFPAYLDPEAFRRSAVHASLLGFDGKWCIHPSQIAIANEVFAPTEDEIERAEEALATYGRSQAEGVGAIGQHGKLVDAAHMRLAANVLDRAVLVRQSDRADVVARGSGSLAQLVNDH